jgi:hypothetical protein
MYNDINFKGYTVKELSDNLTKLLESGMGNRRVMVGPEDGDDGTKPVAFPIVGLEANTDPESSELDILWMYPGEDEWS